MRQIAFYGKGGIGKSTIVQNVAAALAGEGRRVMVIGCDPKADCTALLTGEAFPRTVLDMMRERHAFAYGKQAIGLDVLVRRGCFGVRCVEAGGPDPGVGCAGRGVITAIELLEKEGAFADDLDFAIYDVLGDVVCGGFAMPIREGKAREIYIVTSGEMMSLYAANNIAKGVARFAGTGSARIGGIVCNDRNVSAERDLVGWFAAELGTHVIGAIPRDNMVQVAELNRKTVVEFAPESSQAREYRRLAHAIEGNRKLSVPAPLEGDRLMDMALGLVQVAGPGGA